MQNYYAGNPLNRLSYLRSSPSFLTSALRSPKSQFILLDQLQPLCTPTDPATNERKFVRLWWDRVEKFVGDAEEVFRGIDGKNDEEDVPKLSVIGHRRNDNDDDTSSKATVVGDLSPEEKRSYFLNKPALVFLGVDERSAPESSKSLPLSKPTPESTLESHSPHGVPLWAFDVSRLQDFKKELLGEEEGREFVELRAGSSTIPNDEASIGAEARSLVDWNTRNKFCPGCARPLRSIWAGWKRSCIPNEPIDSGIDEPSCVSKKGVHNYSYPRTDPVVIMAVLSPDREQILLGRQRTWPSRFYSCLAGFIESGESLEEAVRREVYEEAGVVIDQVGYHSSQPWPYPSSLMFGCWGVVKEGSSIRVDLDNELEDARFFTREEVLAVMKSSQPSQLTREEVKKFDQQQHEEGGKDGEKQEEQKKKKKDELAFRMPPATAIANTLVTAWANGTLFNPYNSPNNLLGSSSSSSNNAKF